MINTLKKELLIILILLLTVSCTTNKEALPKKEKCVVKKTKELVVIPDGAHEVIDQILNEPMDELITGDTGYAKNDGLNIWYNSINPGENKETVLFLQGAGTAAVHGNPHWLFEKLVALDYNVIQFDYRETGRSDMQDDLSFKRSYTLEDLGADAIAVLNANNIEKCHIIGLSMGGMVAQSMSIHYPDRIKSVTSMISTGYMMDPKVPSTKIDNMGKFTAELGFKYRNLPLSDRDYLEINIAYINYFKGADSKKIAKDEMYELLKAIYYNKVNEAPYNSKGAEHHNMAVYFSGSRLESLSNVKLPYLVIHGLSDNFVDTKHARKYSSLLENCEILWVEGMGHNVQLRQDYEVMLNEIIPFLNKHS